MAESDLPPGSSSNPSERSRRLPGFVFALAGFGVASYLALYQMGVVAEVWEPFFGNGSRLLLKQSPVAHLLPIPDAALGAFAYLVEAITGAVGGRARWRTAPGLVFLFGAVALALGITGVLLVILQPTFFGTFCTLCLVSAACSISAAFAATGEVFAAFGYFRRERSSGRSLWQALGGRGRRRKGGVG